MLCFCRGVNHLLKLSDSEWRGGCLLSSNEEIRKSQGPILHSPRTWVGFPPSLTSKVIQCPSAGVVLHIVHVRGWRIASAIAYIRLSYTSMLSYFFRKYARNTFMMGMWLLWVRHFTSWIWQITLVDRHICMRPVHGKTLGFRRAACLVHPCRTVPSAGGAV